MKVSLVISIMMIYIAFNDLLLRTSPWLAFQLGKSVSRRPFSILDVEHAPRAKGKIVNLRFGINKLHNVSSSLLVFKVVYPVLWSNISVFNSITLGVPHVILFGTRKNVPLHISCFREHGMQQMKRMGNHGMMGSGTMLDQGYQSGIWNNGKLGRGQPRPMGLLLRVTEKGGILKKPGPPYGPMDPMMDDGGDRYGRSMQHDRMDRISTSSQNQLADRIGPPGGHIPHDVRSLSEAERTLKSLNGYHEGLLEALRSAAASSSHRGSNASSGGGDRGGVPPPHPPPPHGDGRDGRGQFGAHRSSTASLSDELRKHLTDSYLDSFGRGGGGMAGADLMAAMAATLKRSSREKLDNVQQAGPGPSDHDGPGPIRIRNLEDLIRQLEHSSRHMSPSGSEDIRESEAERHFRFVHFPLVESESFIPNFPSLSFSFSHFCFGFVSGCFYSQKLNMFFRL